MNDINIQYVFFTCKKVRSFFTLTRPILNFFIEILQKIKTNLTTLHEITLLDFIFIIEQFY